jgi:uncharacterized protein YecE (DUF72 family)
VSDDGERIEGVDVGVKRLHENLYLGTAGWSYNDWKGTFYPPKTSSADRLGYYAGQFRTVEIDSTFYGIPSLKTVQSWHMRSPDGFVFAPKFPRAVTHEARLVNCADLATTFIETMQELGNRLGPLLLQLPPSFRADSFDDLARFLEGLPDGMIYAVEVRHRSWLIDEYADLLKRWQVAMVLTCGSHLGRFWRATSRIAYIRWLGTHNAFPAYDRPQAQRDEEIAWWAPRMAHFLDRGGTIFGYANNNYEGFSPSTIRRIEAQIAAELGD